MVCEACQPATGGWLKLATNVNGVKISDLYKNKPVVIQIPKFTGLSLV